MEPSSQSHTIQAEESQMQRDASRNNAGPLTNDSNRSSRRYRRKNEANNSQESGKVQMPNTSQMPSSAPKEQSPGETGGVHSRTPRTFQESLSQFNTSVANVASEYGKHLENVDFSKVQEATDKAVLQDST